MGDFRWIHHPLELWLAQLWLARLGLARVQEDDESSEAGLARVQEDGESSENLPGFVLR